MIERLALLLVGALAAPAPSPPPLLQHPQAPLPSEAPFFIREPDGDSLTAVFPSRAMKDAVSGEATMTCQVTTYGALKRCKVVSETPAGFGFGGAALSLAPQFWMIPAKRYGVAVQSDVTIPIRWQRDRVGRSRSQFTAPSTREGYPVAGAHIGLEYAAEPSEVDKP